MAILTGTGPNQLVTAADLGTLGFQNHNEVEIDNGRAALDEYQKAYSAPKIKPTLNLPFARMQTFDPRVSFSRASDAYEYKGDSVKAEENLFLYSEQFDNAYWGKTRATILANQTLAPNGTTTADQTAQQVGQTVYGGVSLVPALNQTYTLSVHAKADTKNFLVLFLNNAGDRVFFDLLNGIVGTTVGVNITASAITLSANGFYRCSITGLHTVSSVGIFHADTDNSTTVVDSGGIFIWGAQLEQRDTLTDYQRTTDRIIQKYVDTYSLVTSNKPRFKEIDPITKERKGLLVEEARTNSVLHSNDFTNGAWVKNVATGATVQKGVPSPIGESFKFVPNASANADSRVNQSFSFSVGTTYTQSLYVKPSGIEILEISTQAGNTGATFDLQNQKVLTTTNSSASIEKVNNGWFRLYVTSAPTAAGQFLIRVTGVTDGYSGIYISQAQLEVGSFPTSPILTGASAVTRASDLARVEGLNLLSSIKQGFGTLYASATLPNFEKLSGNERLAVLQTNSTNYISTGYRNNTVATPSSGQIVLNNTSQSILQIARIYQNGKAFRAGISYKKDQVIDSINGVIVNQDFQADIPNVSQLEIGSLVNIDATRINSTISHVAYYPQALTADELSFLTRNTDE